MINSLKLGSAILFFVGAHLLVPKIADAAARLHQPVIITDISSKQVQVAQDYNHEYEPPNYGGPDSEHGSGTR